MKSLKQELEEFLYKLYFEMYKDFPVTSTEEFRRFFRKKHGDYKYLNELVRDLQNYQIKKHGQTIVF